jgi:hypothetical protein
LLLVRRSTPNAVKAKRYFPVRLKVAMPAGGFGRHYNDMIRWLDEHVGSGAYWVGAEAGPRIVDAALFYFHDVQSARAFVERFACGAILARSAGRSASLN